MEVVIAIDSMKGSLSSLEAGAAAREGILRVYPQARVRVFPLADGGEGTTQALTQGLGGQLATLRVTGPQGAPVTARYGVLGNRAVLEMAAAAGLTLDKRLDPLKATTYGVGELIRDAIARGCRDFIVGLGGSATNDGGMGMLQALGYVFRDANGRVLSGCGESLEKVAAIDSSTAIPELAECRFRAACDVQNPLCGPLGATFVFGPQKGAAGETLERLENGMVHFARVCGEFLGQDLSQAPGTGAAGGMGFAFRAFLDGTLTPGIQLVLDAIGLEKAIPGADVVVTGEGRLDGQTAMGKVPVGVAGLAKKYGKPVIALSGCVTEDAGQCNAAGIDAFFPILRTVVPLEEAMEAGTAEKNMAATAEQVFRLVRAIKA